MDASLYLVFPVATGIAFVATLALLAFAVLRSAQHTASPDERRFKPFKRLRVGTYAALVVLQAVLIVARQWEHWPTLTAIDADGACVLLLYVVTLVRGGPGQGHAPCTRRMRSACNSRKRASISP